MLVIPLPCLRTPARPSQLAAVVDMSTAPCRFPSIPSSRRILLVRLVDRGIARNVSVQSLTVRTTARHVSGVC
jgi:hypothetical protein